MIPFRGCDHCGSIRFFAGPRGGSSQNVTCTDCGARFNLVIPPIPGPLLLVDELSGPSDGPVPAYIIELVLGEPALAGGYRDALEAVLLFHSASPWTPEKRARWAKLTGEAEATTRALCDAVRRALG
jgi:hypothetical protein